MSVMISIIGPTSSSDEFIAAEKLKRVIEETIPKDAIGEIIIAPSATLFGQVVKDIDILIIGILENCNIKTEFKLNNENIYDFVSIRSFCTTIELKSHDISGIVRKGTDFYVKYGYKEHSATQQSNQQKISAMNFFSSVLTNSPFITNIIWFNQILKSELKNLVTMDQRAIPHNLLSSEFNFKDFIQLLFLQREPFRSRNGYVYDSNYNNASIDDFKRALDLFRRSKASMGELTRQRIEQITNDYLVKKSLIQPEDRFSLYRGRAGTGKTVGLIQVAIRLVEERDARVILLTYNKALVSDLRRLFAFAELPDMFSINSISISTMQSFFYKIASKVIYNEDLDGLYYIRNYEKIIGELIQLIKDDHDTKELIKLICSEDITLNWDYVLIDEAQDWSVNEKNLILSLYDKEKIIVADGGQQFVRNIELCDWTEIKDRQSFKLKHCLRQKENLVHFLNILSEKSGITGNRIITNNKMPGGRIIILSEKKLIYDLYEKEMSKLKSAGNMPYDMLFLVPPNMVSDHSGRRQFRYKPEYEENGIFIWDGTNEEVRSTYPTVSDEIRLLQYDSSRGLEAWTVFCLDFDKFIEAKESLFDPNEESNSLILESKEERRLKYINNWMMIPLTRAIDTIVITLDDAESDIGKLLCKISEENSDYVSWL